MEYKIPRPPQASSVASLFIGPSTKILPVSQMATRYAASVGVVPSKPKLMKLTHFLLSITHDKKVGQSHGFFPGATAATRRICWKVTIIRESGPQGQEVEELHRMWFSWLSVIGATLFDPLRVSSFLPIPSSISNVINFERIFLLFSNVTRVKFDRFCGWSLLPLVPRFKGSEFHYLSFSLSSSFYFGGHKVNVTDASNHNWQVPR